MIHHDPRSLLHADHTQITGDDTPALQAVLDADVWRKVLLKDEAVSFQVRPRSDPPIV